MLSNRIFLGVCLVLLSGFGVCYWLVWREGPESPKRMAALDNPPLTPPSMRPLSIPAGPLEKVLIVAGWKEAAARQFAALIGERLGDPRQPGPHQMHLTLLKALGQHPETMPLLEEHPELAGLLAAVNEPRRLAPIFSHGNGQHFHRLAGLYQIYTARDDRELLTTALQENGNLIVELLELGMLGSEQLFFFGQTTHADGEYKRWLVEQLRRHVLAPAASEEERAEFQTFLTRQGDPIRRRLHKDAGFRQRFLNDLWPRFEELAADDHLWDLYAEFPVVWDVLALEDGVELLQKYSVLPCALLFGRQGLPQDLHSFAREMLRAGHDRPIEALERFFRLSEFQALLRRKLTSATFKGVFAELLGKDSEEDVRKTLAYYASLSESALHKAYSGEPKGLIADIPGYSIYRLIDKWDDGVETSNGDYMAAVLDVSSLGFPAGKAGSIIVTKLGNTVRQQGQKQALRQFERQAARSGSPYAQRLAKQTVTAVTKGTEAASFAQTAILRDLQPQIRALDEKIAINITEPVKFLFSYSGVGRGSFKAITKFEARLFMRRDARILISPLRLAQTIGEERAATDLRERLKEMMNGAADPPDRDLPQAWRRNAAAWWLYQLDPID